MMESFASFILVVSILSACTGALGYGLDPSEGL
jgi:hypothetical protein